MENPDHNQDAIIRSRLNKEKTLLETANLTNTTVEFNEETRIVKVKTLVYDSDVFFYIHLPARYPFLPPEIT